MYPDVAVMYGDLQIVRVPWEQKESLRRDYVICIAVINLENPRPHVRHQQAIENDYYVLTWDGDSCYLGGYDDDKYWFKFDRPWRSYGEGFIHKFPFILREQSILFEGVMVAPEVYKKAKEMFYDRRGVMY